MVPRAQVDHSISALVVGGAFEKGSIETSHMAQDSWGSVIQEMVLNAKIIQKGLAHGQEDFKFTVYGNKGAGPLSLAYNVKGTGHVSDYLCLFFNEYTTSLHTSYMFVVVFYL